MVDALSPSLDGLGGWRAVYPRRVLEAVARWPDSSDLAAGRLVARTVGAGRVVLGSALATRRELRLRADVYDPVRGRVLWSAEARGAPSDPLPLIDSLAVELVRPRLTTQMSRGRSLVQELATTDPRALRAFLAAEPLARRGDVVAAADSLLHAIALDSTFALAYVRLWVASTRGPVNRGVLRLVRAGARHAARLPPRQRDLLLTVAAQTEELRLEALRSGEDLERRYPDDPEAAYLTADGLYHYGLGAGIPLARVFTAFERAIALDSTLSEPYQHAVGLAFALGDTARAWALRNQFRRQNLTAAPAARMVRADSVPLRHAARLAFEGDAVATIAAEVTDPNEWTAIGDYVRAMLFDRDPAAALALMDSCTTRGAQSGAPPETRLVEGLQWVIRLVARGRYREATDTVRAFGGGDSPLLVLRYALPTGRDRDAGREAMRRALVDTASDIGLLGQAVAFAANDADSAALAFGAGRLETLGASAGVRLLVDGLRGLVDLRRGDTLQAREQLPYTFQSGHYAVVASLDAWPHAALALARLEPAKGALENAARVLHESLLSPSYRAEAEELSGLIAEQQGDTTTAIRSYRNFVELWKEADLELQPRVIAARAALARLER